MNKQELKTISTALRFLLSNLDEEVIDTLQDNGGFIKEEGIEGLIKKIEEREEMPEGTIPFELIDQTDTESVNGFVRINPCGIAISILGHNSVNKYQDSNCVAYLEKYDNKLGIRVYDDAKIDEPTHNINLAGAKN